MNHIDILICPGCGDEVSFKDDACMCQNLKCAHSKTENYFHMIQNAPILISDIYCDTLCSGGSSVSLVKRTGDGGNLRWLKKHIVGQSKTTVRNIAKFIELLQINCREPSILIIGAGEIGSGTDALYETNFEIIGTDVYFSSTVDIVADAHYLPFKNGVFDGVVIQAVLEHVVEPHVVVKEIHRILKADGVVYAETPFMQQVHEGAFDFTRFTVLGHRFLFRDFEKIDAGGLDGVGVVLAWSMRAFVHGLTRSRLIAKLCFLPLKLVLTLLEKLADKRSLHDANSGSYFLGRRSEISLTHKQIISEYKGFGK